MKIDVRNNDLIIKEKSLFSKYKIETTIFFREIYLVLFDPSSCEEKWNSFANLYAFDKEGKQLWIAELSIYGSYYKIEVMDEQIIAIAPSCDCYIDPQNGKIIKEDFTK